MADIIITATHVQVTTARFVDVIIFNVMVTLFKGD